MGSSQSVIEKKKIKPAMRVLSGCSSLALLLLGVTMFIFLNGYSDIVDNSGDDFKREYNIQQIMDFGAMVVISIIGCVAMKMRNKLMFLVVAVFTGALFLLVGIRIIFTLNLEGDELAENEDLGDVQAFSNIFGDCDFNDVEFAALDLFTDAEGIQSACRAGNTFRIMSLIPLFVNVFAALQLAWYV